MAYMRNWVTALIGLCAGAMMLTSAAGAAEPLRVLATGVFATSLRDLGTMFEAAGGTRLQVTVANAGGVDAMLARGEPADVVMTSAAGLQALAHQGRLNVASRIEIGRMRLGLGIRTGASLPDVTSPGTTRAMFLAASQVAYIDPHGGATAGTFSEMVFSSLGIADAVHAKAIRCVDGADVVAALVAWKAEVGMAQASEIQGAPGVTFAGYLPDALNTTTLYVAAAVATTPPASAAAFLRFMQGPIAAERLRRAGWDMIKP